MMIQDIAPHRLNNAYTPREPRQDDALLCARGDALLVGKNEDGTVRLPTFAELGQTRGQYLFSLDGRGCYLWEGEKLAETEACSYVPSRTLRDAPPTAELYACAVAESLARWYAQNRFCGRCGAERKKSETERALVCPECGDVAYPKICPAIIVAVCDGDRIVLTRYAGRAFKRYALVGGFNEIGESIEDTVRREVMEELGLQVKNLRFYKSQPWAYTDSLLFGFFADLDGSDAIRRQEAELSEARWFARDELPDDHSAISLTGEMIELFRDGKEPR
ncbi:MAG: NAD(+) diphosphatase [Oscillospiraceae bacterium]|nr:NAD(+) diphosphatase [Oscillospiraceae bacterium]